MRRAQQIDLFSPDAVALRQELDCASAAYVALQAERAAAQEALTQCQRELAEAQRQVVFYQSQVRIYKTLAEELWVSHPHGPAPEPRGPTRAALTRLLALAHPDKWSQGQLASELAHEVSVHNNAIRQEVQP